MKPESVYTNWGINDMMPKVVYTICFEMYIQSVWIPSVVDPPSERSERGGSTTRGMKTDCIYIEKQIVYTTEGWISLIPQWVYTNEGFMSLSRNSRDFLKLIKLFTSKNIIDLKTEWVCVFTKLKKSFSLFSSPAPCRMIATAIMQNHGTVCDA